MANVYDVAAYILNRRGSMTTWKLQKLVYYSQAWSLVWDEAPLFDEEIEAWANGPVVRQLYNIHRGHFSIAMLERGDPDALSDEQRESVDAVLNFYGEKPSQWLSDLTHMEDPWKNAREGLADGDRSSRVITKDSMAEYYGSL